MKSKIKHMLPVLISALLFFAACDDTDNNITVKSPGDSVITIAGITGVTPPAYGETPATVITETDQFTGTVSWSGSPVTFDAENIYTATITLSAKMGYTFTGLVENFFTVAGATSVTNSADTGVVIAVFPETGEVPPVAVDISAIPGVTQPVFGETPATVITETSQFTGTITWLPDDNPFGANTAYTATITLSAKTGYTMTGVSADYFTITGAISVSNAADSGVVTAVFPETEAAAAAESGFSAATTIGDEGSITAGSESAVMIYANNQSSITFPTETDDSGTSTLTTQFFMSETEVTNVLYTMVLQWAYDKGKFSASVSDHNGLDDTTAKYGSQELIDLDNSDCRISYSSGTFSVESSYEDHPVTNITWYGTVIFCNFLTEMRDGNTDNVVYTGIDETWEHTETIDDSTQTGYRLPSIIEWEYAARYTGTDTGGRTDLVSQGTNGGSASLTAGYYWTPGDYLSGATTYYNDTSDSNSNGIVDGKEANDMVAVYYYYFDGSWLPTGVTGTAVVKSKTANALGLYDMSGNVWDWCFDEDSGGRALRGGGWDFLATSLRVGHRYSNSPDSNSSWTGFRFARTAD